MTKHIVLLSAIALAFLERTVGSSAERILQGDDFDCPDKEDTLLYNIDIIVEGVGDGCDPGDLFDLGGLLQQIVKEVEVEIPKYPENERMNTLICPIPLADSRRYLGMANESSRMLQTSTTDRYRYRGGGECRRCLKRNARAALRSLQQREVSVDAICQMADMAGESAKLALEASKSANKIFSDMKDMAVECSVLRSGQNLIMLSARTFAECKRARRFAVNSAKRAAIACNQAKGASTDTQIEGIQQQAAKEAGVALVAADKARQFHSQMRGAPAMDICQQPVTRGQENKRTAEAACSFADMATFGSYMAATAVRNARASFLELRKRFSGCAEGIDVVSAKMMVANNKELIDACRTAQNGTNSAARESRWHCQKARATTSEQELAWLARRAEKFSIKALLDAERVRYGYFAIKKNLEQHNCTNFEQEQRSNVGDSGSNEEASQESTEGGSEPEGCPPNDIVDDNKAIFMQWLERLGKLLYERIPPRVVAQYTSSQSNADAQGCILEGFTMELVIVALEQLVEVENWITEKDCVEQ